VESAARKRPRGMHVAWYANAASSRQNSTCARGLSSRHTRVRCTPITNTPSSVGRRLGRCAEVGQSVGRRAIFSTKARVARGTVVMVRERVGGVDLYYRLPELSLGA
jgi:hypothetical protein